jgi:hypothetical protein
MRYPTSCLSEFCGNILCDGCRNRDTLVLYHHEKGGKEQVIAFETGQAQLRQHKIDKTGPFSYLADEQAKP